MRIYAVGLDHRTCPLEILERVAAAATQMRRFDVAGDRGGSRPEAWALLSTCNRFEIYAHFEVGEKGIACSAAYKALTRFISARSGLSEATFGPYLTRYAGKGAVEHLARVASGVESAVIGEPEILGQIREALEAARRRGGVSDVIEALFRNAIRAGRCARSETDISRGSASFATAIADIVYRSDAKRGKRNVVVVGLGHIGTKAVRVLRKRGSIVHVVTRTASSQERTKETTVFGVDDLPRLLQAADAVVLATTSETPVLTRPMVETAIRARDGRELDVVDAGMPRNVDHSIAELDAVRLFDLEGIAAKMQDVIEKRRNAAGNVEAVIAREIEDFEKWRRARESTAVIGSLRRKAEHIRKTEIARALDRMPDLPPEARDLLENVSSAIVRKLLHEPTLNLRNSGDDVRKERSRAVQDLFALRRP